MKSAENPFGLSADTIDAIKKVFSKFPGIEKAVIYGSRAKGNYKTGSDIDLVLVAPTLKSTDLSKIELELDDLMLPYTLDLSVFHLIENEALIDHINRVGLEFFRCSS